MPDSQYRELPLIFQSKGIFARQVDDLVDPQGLLAETNVEELAEGAYAQRLGSYLINKAGPMGGAVYPLSGKVVTVGKLGQLFNQYFRYAVTADGNLWRRTGLNPGPYAQILAGLSGQPCSMQSWTNTDFTSSNYLLIADQNGIYKDNGTFANPQKAGIFPPQFPINAQSQEPTTLVVLDNYTNGTSGYSNPQGLTLSTQYIVNTSLSSGVLATGIQSVTVVQPQEIGLFQMLTIDTGANMETVLVLLTTKNVFVANFIKTHASGATVTALSLSAVVPASTTATISQSFGTKLFPISETVYGNQSDYIGIYLGSPTGTSPAFDPNQIQSITLKFDCGDGSFNSDYFYKVIAQGPLQNLVSTSTSSTDPTTALTDALLSSSLNLYGNQPGGIGELNTGTNTWTPLLFQLSDFAASGRADYNDPVYNWSNVNGYQIQIVTNNNTSVTVGVAALVLFGGAGPDTLGGVAYDYVWTWFNPVDGTESNPSPLMTNQDPPNGTNWVYPRRQPVLLNINWNMWQSGSPPYAINWDRQATYARIYRRGGTLGDNFRRIDQVPINPATGGTLQYIDTVPDYQIAGSPIVSFKNDVPVPSLLPVPVNTTLSAAITGGSWQAVTPVSMANIFVGQQVTLGNPTAIQNNFETVVVTSINGTSSFNAYVQNNHSVGDQVQASIKPGQPVFGMVIAFNRAWYWGDPNNPSTLYFSAGNAPQYVSEANNVIVSTPDDYITAVVPYKGNMWVSCIKSGWWMIPPDTPATQAPYPTACKHACVAPFGYVATEEMIVYQGPDGIRGFAGGASVYLTQMIEFIFQGVGTTPIVEADLTQLTQTVIAYWNMMVFVSYIGTDGKRHRIIYHQEYKRFRNDDADAQCIFLEADTNLLIYGDSNGLVHIDRQDLPYDESNNGGLLAEGPIAMNMQTAYNFQGSPANQKQYQALQLDVNTGGQELNVAVLFNDGEIVVPLGTFSNTQRGKINFSINNGLGQQAYKCSLQITGNVTAFAYLYQTTIEALVLPRTRQR
jgi:hypothetical protein